MELTIHIYKTYCKVTETFGEITVNFVVYYIPILPWQRSITYKKKYYEINMRL